jgi:hypothetical protein
MKLIIYCDCCGVLIPNAMRRGEACEKCQAGQKTRVRIHSDEISGRRPSARQIMAELRRSVKLPVAV